MRDCCDYDDDKIRLRSSDDEVESKQKMGRWWRCRTGRRLGLDGLLYTRDQGVDAVTKYFVVAGITEDVDVIVE